MIHSRRDCLLGGIAAALLPWRAGAQDAAYPSRPVRFLVGFAPGGPADSVTRLFASRLQAQLGQTVIVENMPGAGSTLGIARLSKMAPDGYAIGFAHTASLSIGPSLYRNVGYDPLKDLTPVAKLCEYVNVLAVRADSPWRSLADLLASARAQPGALSYGSAGIGSTNHLSGELLAAKAGAKLTHVPYRGTALAINDLMGGALHFVFDAPNSAGPLAAAGKLRLLATTGRHRHKLYPDLPAIAETVPDYEFRGWMGVVAPPGLPPAVQQRLTREMELAAAAPDTGERLAALGLDVAFGGPQGLTRVIATELALWGPLIKSLNLTVQ
ncbi:MAG: tripartite tricarboxylate transporter substrate binding protein [Burkholderiaceae bacterium]|nr:tripartite tricarboxylate transporter substrate binding protein [Burkholderiaceae bacterium]